MMTNKSIHNDTLDLHGVRHADVSRKVDMFLTETINSELEYLYIVTGVSNDMKQIVIETIQDYNVEYDIGDPWNNGYIRLKV